MSVDWNASAALRAIHDAVNTGVYRGIERIRGEALDLIYNTPKTGRIYRRRIYRRRGVEHQASAPGEPPAVWTGRLAGSARSDSGGDNVVTEYDRNQFVGRLTFATYYAAFLEFGTQTMEPRPFLRPAVTNTRGEVEGYIDEEVRAVLG